MCVCFFFLYFRVEKKARTSTVILHVFAFARTKNAFNIVWLSKCRCIMWRKQLLAVIIAVTFLRLVGVFLGSPLFWLLLLLFPSFSVYVFRCEHACTCILCPQNNLHLNFPSSKFKMVFRFYSQSFSFLLCICVSAHFILFSIEVVARLRPLFPLWAQAHISILFSPSHFVIVLFWFSRTYIPNGVDSGMRFCVDDCWLGVVIVISLSLSRSRSSRSPATFHSLLLKPIEKCSAFGNRLHDSAFYCRFYGTKIHLTFIVRCSFSIAYIDGLEILQWRWRRIKEKKKINLKYTLTFDKQEKASGMAATVAVANKLTKTSVFYLKIASFNLSWTNFLLFLLHSSNYSPENGAYTTKNEESNEFLF